MPAIRRLHGRNWMSGPRARCASPPGRQAQPKGVLYSHRGTVLSALSTGGGNGWALSANDTVLGIPGFFHCNGWAVPFLAPDVRCKACAAGPTCRQRMAAPADRRGRRHNRRRPCRRSGCGILEHCRATGEDLAGSDASSRAARRHPSAMIEAYLTRLWRARSATAGA